MEENYMEILKKSMDMELRSSYEFIHEYRSAAANMEQTFTCPNCGSQAWIQKSSSPAGINRFGCKRCGFQIFE